MIHRGALLLLAPLWGMAVCGAQAADPDALTAQTESGGWHLFTPSKARLADDLAALAGQDHKSLVLAVPVVTSEAGYSLCLLYDYARTDTADPISATGLDKFDGSKDAHNLGLGLRGFMTERLEFEAVVGHSHVDASSNSAYAGLIYDVDSRFGLGADFGTISAAGQDNKRLRAFARFYF